jgi:hypothetical protein
MKIIILSKSTRLSQHRFAAPSFPDITSFAISFLFRFFFFSFLFSLFFSFLSSFLFSSFLSCLACSVLFSFFAVFLAKSLIRRFAWTMYDELLWVAVAFDPRFSLHQKEYLFRSLIVVSPDDYDSDSSSASKPLNVQYPSLSVFFQDFLSNNAIPRTLQEENDASSHSVSVGSSSLSSAPFSSSLPSSAFSSSSSSSAASFSCVDGAFAFCCAMLVY